MHKKKSDPKSPGLPWRCGGRLGVQMSAQGEYFKVENNSLELTRIFKENIMTDCEREKKV